MKCLIISDAKVLPHISQSVINLLSVQQDMEFVSPTSRNIYQLLVLKMQKAKVFCM